jgi:hypothetical protein
MHLSVRYLGDRIGGSEVRILSLRSLSGYRAEAKYQLRVPEDGQLATLNDP